MLMQNLLAKHNFYNTHFVWPQITYLYDEVLLYIILLVNDYQVLAFILDSNGFDHRWIRYCFTGPYTNVISSYDANMYCEYD